MHAHLVPRPTKALSVEPDVEAKRQGVLGQPEDWVQAGQKVRAEPARRRRRATGSCGPSRGICAGAGPRAREAQEFAHHAGPLLGFARWALQNLPP